MKQLNAVYSARLARLTAAPRHLSGTLREYNDRTGDYVHRFREPQVISVDLSGGVPCPRWRRIHPAPALADLLWQLSETADLSWLNRHAPYIWGPYVENGLLPRAYGLRYVWQLPTLIEHLISDPSSRQAYLGIWHSQDDMADGPRSPMPPCPVGMHFRVRQRGNLTLDATLVLRSSDIMIGLPHDLMTFGMLLTLVARATNYRVGRLHMTLLDLHLYAGHRTIAQSMLRQDWLPPIALETPSLIIGDVYRMTWSDMDATVIACRGRYQDAVLAAPYYMMDVPR